MRLQKEDGPDGPQIRKVRRCAFDHLSFEAFDVDLDVRRLQAGLVNQAWNRRLRDASGVTRPPSTPPTR